MTVDVEGVPPFVESSLLQHRAFYKIETEGISDEVILLLESATRVALNNADAHNELGFCYYKKGEFQLAEASAEQAVAYAPGNPKFRSALIAARISRAELESSRLTIADCAFVAYEEVVILARLHSDYPPVYLAWARLLGLCGESSKCCEDKLHEAQNAYMERDRMGCGLATTPQLIAQVQSQARYAYQQAQKRWFSAHNDLDYSTATEYWNTTPLPSRLGPYDIFVSYASQDAEVVRHVIELLIAHGLRVWFAEYQILLSARPAWEESVRDGIDNCKHGLVFLGQEYFNKEPCRIEWELLKERCQSEETFSVSKINLEPIRESHVEAKRLTPHTDYFTCVLHNTLESIQSHLSKLNVIDLHNIEITDDDLSDHDCDFICLGIQGMLGLTNWQRTSDQEVSCNNLPEGTLFQLNLIHLRTDLSAEVTGRLILEHDSFKSSSLTFDETLNYARDPDRNVSSSIRGVHIVRYRERPGVAVTHKDGAEWCRTVWIHVPYQDNTGDNYILFEFKFKIIGTFQSYCSYTRTMDLFVKSLRWPITHKSTTLEVFDQARFDKLNVKAQQRFSEYPKLRNATIPEMGYLAHYVAAWQALGRRSVNLELGIDKLTLEAFGLCLVYRWEEHLSPEDTDRMDTRLRAFVNCIIGLTAEAAGLNCHSIASPGNLKFVPVEIPGWQVEGFPPMPILVVASQFDLQQQLVQIHVGVPLSLSSTSEPPPAAERLLRQFRNQWRRLIV